MALEKFSKKNLIQFYRKKKDYKIISWQLTKWCNYNCPYCTLKHEDPKKMNDKYHHFPKWEDLEKPAKKLNKMIEEQDSKVEIILIGGEVTWLPLKKLMDECLTSKKICNIRITSNMSQKLSWWEEFSDLCRARNVNLKVLCSIHLSQIKDWNAFAENAIYLGKEWPKFTSVTGVVNNENIDSILEKFVDLKNRGYEAKFSPMIERGYDNKIVELTEENKEKLKEYVTEANSPFYVELENKEPIKTNRMEIMICSDCNFNGFNCISDKFKYTVDGKLYVSSCQSARILTDKLESQAVKCKQNVCSMCAVERVWKDGAIDRS